MGSAPAFQPEPDKIQRRGMRYAIIAQCFGCLAYLAFFNGLLLLYLTALQFSSAQIVLFLALPFVGDAVVRLPCAYLADRYGKKRIGVIGASLEVIGFLAITLAGFWPQPWSHRLAFMGCVLYGIGSGLYASGWFALLIPLVPDHLRGRFFGKLRFSWQVVGIAFAGVCAMLIPPEASLGVHQFVMLLMAIALLIRVGLYLGIPELEKPRPHGDTFLSALDKTLHIDNLVSFCAYVFLLTLFTAACPAMFGLVQKKVMDLPDGAIVWMGNLLMIGSVLGFLLGGRAVDRFGTKPVFLFCHFSYGATLFLFLLRGWSPELALFLVGLSSFAYGLANAASSIAITTELLALTPPSHKSLSTSLCNVLMRGGAALSGILASWAINLGLLSPHWSLGDMGMSQYDAILLAFAVMIVMLVVTLGLVPSVIRKAEWIPR